VTGFIFVTLSSMTAVGVARFGCFLSVRQSFQEGGIQYHAV
jgi:hypothetical protein